MKRKLLSILLTLCLAFSLLPTAALAAEGETSGEVVQQGSSVSLPENNRGNFTISEEGAVLDGTGVTYTDGTITVTAADVTIKNLIFGDKAKLVVNTSGKFTLTGCTFAPQTVYDKATRLPVRTAVNLNVGQAEVTNNTFEGVTNGYYNAIEFGIGADDNDLKAATISGNTFKSAIANNYFSFYNMTNDAQIDIVNNKLLLAAKSSNGIRISNYHNATGVTFNIDSDEYTYATDSADSEYEGLILLQDYSEDSAVQNFSDITLNVTNLTAPESAKQLLYVYDNQAGIISTNQPVVKGDNSIEKFFVAKVDKTYYKTLAEAVAAVPTNGTETTITLLNNVAFTGHININEGKNIILNLNGHDIVSTDAKVFDVYHSKFHVTGSGSINEAVENGYAPIIARGSGTDTADYTVITIDKTVTLKGDYSGIFVAKDDTSSYKNYGLVINMYGSIELAKDGVSGYAIYINGTNQVMDGNVTTFNLTGAQISGDAGCGIYAAGYAVWKLKDTTITGENALSLKAGNFTIDGGAYKSTGEYVNPGSDTSNGAVETGAALSLTSNDGYAHKLDVTVNGGTFESVHGNAVYEGIPLSKKEPHTPVASKSYVTLKINDGNFKSAADKAVADLTKIENKQVISGGLFSSDPSAYCVTGMTGVASGNSQYPYTVGDKDENAQPAHVDTATVPAKTAEGASQAVKDVAKEITGANVTNNAAEAATKDLANENKLTGSSALEDNTTVVDKLNAATRGTTGAENVAIVYQTYVDVVVSDATAGSNGKITELEVNLTPMYRVVATAKTVVEGNEKIVVDGTSGVNAVIIEDGKKLTLPEAEYEVRLSIPANFAAEINGQVSVKHTKDNGQVEYYTGTVTKDDTTGRVYVAFTTKGFSPFVISSAVASIDGVMYPTLAEAIAKAANGSIIKLEKDCDESVSVSGKSLTINKNSHGYDFAKVTVDSNSTKTENGDTLTITYTAPSYSSGSSSDPTYSVSTPSKTEHGTVTVSPKSASKGDTVTVTVKPDSGYVLETLTVTDKNGNELTLKDKGNGKYTFTMPAGKVEVKATFMEDNSMLNFFYDVPNNAYFYEAVKWAVKNGITTGVGNNLFAPEQPCTRAQIVTFLWRAAGSPEPKGAASGMTDVVSGSYYEKAVAWAIENGITTGTTTSTFSPDATCTRAQAVTFLARALNAKAASAAEFSDVPTDSYFADAVAWAAANGVTEGIGGGLFGSDNDCTRGQIVTFLYRAYNK